MRLLLPPLLLETVIAIVRWYEPQTVMEEEDWRVVLLLDRLMSAAPQLREDLLVMASVTALRVLAAGQTAQGGGGDGSLAICAGNEEAPACVPYPYDGA